MTLIVLLLIVLAVIAFPIAVHFTMLPITEHYRRRLMEETGKDLLYRNNRVSVYLSTSKSLMVDIEHVSKESSEFLYGDESFARCLNLHIGGVSVFFRYGHDFRDYVPGDDSVTRYYGLYSIDCEKFWSSIWIGHRIYDNPFRHCKFQGYWIYDISQNKFIPHDTFGYDVEKYPIALKLSGVNYTTKRGELQDIQDIWFWIEKRIWVSPIIKFMGLSRLFNKTVIDLEFVIRSGEGIGDDRDSWKGGVLQSSCTSTLTDQQFKAWMDRVTRHPHEVGRFKEYLDYRVKDWLVNSRRY